MDYCKYPLNGKKQVLGDKMTCFRTRLGRSGARVEPMSSEAESIVLPTIETVVLITQWSSWSALDVSI